MVIESVEVRRQRIEKDIPTGPLPKIRGFKNIARKE